MPAGSPRAGQGHRCPRLHPGLLRSHEGWGWGTPWCEPSRKHPQGLVVGTRQGWAEKGIFAPSRGGTEATHDPGAPPTLPRRIPSVLGWEGHHRITTESESEVNVKRSVSSLGNPSRMVGRRAQCGPRIWGGWGRCVWAPAPTHPEAHPHRSKLEGAAEAPSEGDPWGSPTPATPPPPPCTFPGGTRTHPGPVPIYILGFTHTHLGFLEGVARVPCAPRFASSRCRERIIPKKIRPPPGVVGGSRGAGTRGTAGVAGGENPVSGWCRFVTTGRVVTKRHQREGA